MKIKQKLERGIANIWIRPFFNILVEIFLDEPQAYYINDIDFKLRNLGLALYFNNYKHIYDCFIQVFDEYGSKLMKDKLIVKPFTRVFLEYEGEKWVKDKNIFYLLKTREPVVLTNLRNSYTENYWKDFSFEIENSTEVTIISPLCVLRMYKEKAL